MRLALDQHNVKPKKSHLAVAFLYALILSHGGRGGIRTRGRFNPTYAFQAYDLNRSSTLPLARYCSAAVKRCFSNCSIVTNLSALAWVDSSTTGGATPAANASAHRVAHRHQRSPALKPLKRYSGLGVVRSLPRSFEKAKNSDVTRAQIRCEPVSASSVLQQPSLK